MYKLGEYKFESLKHNSCHRKNYVALSDHGGRELGMKYSLIYCYADEYNTHISKKLNDIVIDLLEYNCPYRIRLAKELK